MTECVEPHVSEGREMSMCPTPQERWEAYCEAATAVSSEDLSTADVCAARNEDDAAPVCINLRYHVFARELRFPGTVADTEPIAGKWLYVFRDKTLIVEAYAAGAASWKGKDHETGATWESTGEIYIDPGPAGARYSYQFFLSPVKLSDGGKKILTKGATLSTAAITAGCQELGQTVNVCDPLRWAADMHRLYYAPAVRAWQGWMLDENRQAQLFIATVLKGWIDADDQFGADNELRSGEPDKWLDAYKKREARLRKKAEEAAAHLAHAVDSNEYFAVETSCMDNGKEDLSIGFQAWGAICRGLLETEPGRAFVAGIVANDDRLPTKYLFTDSPPSNALGFGEYRYAWLGAWSVFEELVAGRIRYLEKQGVSALDKVRLYLEHLGVETLKGSYRHAYRNIAEGKRLTTGVPKKKRGAFLESVERLEKKANKWGDHLKSPAELSAPLDKWHNGFQANYGATITSVTFIIEVANLAVAISEYKKAEGYDKTSKMLSMIGATADMTIVLTQIGESLVKSGTHKRILSGVAGSATMVSGVMDMLAFEEDAVAAVGVRDYSQAVGHGIAAVGAGVTVVAGGMLLAKAITGGAIFGGPVGAIVGAVGGVLIVAGTVFAAWVKNTPHEEFAEYCFLGDESDDDPWLPWWSPFPLPCRGNYVLEAQVLAALLSHFHCKIEGWSSISIKPGFVYDESYFEIDIEKHYQMDPVVKARVAVYLDEDEVVLLDGERTRGGGVVRNDDGTIREIRLSTDRVDKERARAFAYCRAAVRLSLSEKANLVTPVNHNWVRLSYALQSLSQKNEATSLERDHIVDGSFKPIDG